MAAFDGASAHCFRVISWGDAGKGGGRHAFGDHVEDSGGLEVGIESGVEGVLECGRLGVSRRRFEVRDGEADALHSKVGARLYPVLREGAHRATKKETAKKQQGSTNERLDLPGGRILHERSYELYLLNES